MSRPFRARLDGQETLVVGKVVCVGRNYAEHARELNNPIPEQPLLFMKPNTAVVDLNEPLVVPEGANVHYETELALLIGERLQRVSAAQSWQGVAGLGLALDLTRRDLQSELKRRGHPWELAKAFDGSCPLSEFVGRQDEHDPQALRFSLCIDDNEVQSGNTADLLCPIPRLLAFISSHFTLEPGDVVLTGTPAGVGVLPHGASLRLQASFGLDISTRVS